MAGSFREVHHVWFYRSSARMKLFGVLVHDVWMTPVENWEGFIMRSIILWQHAISEKPIINVSLRISKGSWSFHKRLVSIRIWFSCCWHSVKLSLDTFFSMSTTSMAAVDLMSMYGNGRTNYWGGSLGRFCNITCDEGMRQWVENFPPSRRVLSVCSTCLWG